MQNFDSEILLLSFPSRTERTFTLITFTTIRFMFFFFTRQKLNQEKKIPDTRKVLLSWRRNRESFDSARFADISNSWTTVEKKRSKKEKSSRANGKLWKSSRKNFTDFKRIPGLSLITYDIYMKDAIRKFHSRGRRKGRKER